MPVFTSAPATLRARRASRTPTSPVNPDTPDTAVRPTSPPVPLESESLVLKAKRAYERDRQRTKKRKERADRERERERSASESHAPPEPWHAREGSGRRARPPRMTIGIPAEVGVDAKDKETFLLSPAVEEIIADIVEREAQARGELEVHIEQLVKPGKPVVEHLMQWSGITVEGLSNATATFDDVQARMLSVTSIPPTPILMR